MAQSAISAGSALFLKTGHPTIQVAKSFVDLGTVELQIGDSKKLEL